MEFVVTIKIEANDSEPRITTEYINFTVWDVFGNAPELRLKSVETERVDGAPAPAPFRPKHPFRF